MVAFRRWEGAVELHAACLDRVRICFTPSNIHFGLEGTPHMIPVGFAVAK
jgi:hypothetical protein